MAERFLTIEQVASRLHIHPGTVRRHLKSGILRGRKQGKLWRVPESALTETPPVGPTISPLVRALALVEARDARSGNVTPRVLGVNDAATEIRQMREDRTR